MANNKSKSDQAKVDQSSDVKKKVRDLYQYVGGWTGIVTTLGMAAAGWCAYLLKSNLEESKKHGESIASLNTDVGSIKATVNGLARSEVETAKSLGALAGVPAKIDAMASVPTKLEGTNKDLQEAIKVVDGLKSLPAETKEFRASLGRTDVALAKATEGLQAVQAKVEAATKSNDSLKAEVGDIKKHVSAAVSAETYKKRVMSVVRLKRPEKTMEAVQGGVTYSFSFPDAVKHLKNDSTDEPAISVQAVQFSAIVETETVTVDAEIKKDGTLGINLWSPVPVAREVLESGRIVVSVQLISR